ncbi:hypothetical protein, partial [Paenibacillus graminis]|uniref:hypothetical protein n=1 Tax=Paenibacillus graminis TaxID=189425 RepID=UPI002DBD07AF
MSMTPERKEENKLKKGDHVVMHTCIEAETHKGRIWTCKSDQFTRGTGVYEQDSVFLEGYSGSFAPEFLQKVMLPSEDERLLAALEEAEKPDIKSINKIKKLEADLQSALAVNQKYLCDIERINSKLAEAQQTIAR